MPERRPSLYELTPKQGGDCYERVLPPEIRPDQVCITVWGTRQESDGEVVPDKVLEYHGPRRSFSFLYSIENEQRGVTVTIDDGRLVVIGRIAKAELTSLSAEDAPYANVAASLDITLPLEARGVQVRSFF